MSQKETSAARSAKNVRQWLESVDVEFYLGRQTLKAAAKGAPSELKVSREKLTGLAADYCKFWRRRRKPIRKGSMLTDRSWLEVKRAVEELKSELAGRPLHECVELVRSRVSVSAAVLKGLPSRLHVWEGGSK